MLKGRGLFSVDEILGVLSSSMAILGGGDEVVIGSDFSGQFLVQDLDQIVAGQEICGVTVCQTLLWPGTSTPP